MNIKIYGLVAMMAGAAALTSCDTDVEHIDVQKPYTFDETYFKNIRDFKKELRWNHAAF